MLGAAQSQPTQTHESVTAPLKEPPDAMDKQAIKTHARIDAISRVVQIMWGGRLAHLSDDECRVVTDTLFDIFKVPDDAPEIANNPERALHRAEYRLTLEVINDGAMQMRANVLAGK